MSTHTKLVFLFGVLHVADRETTLLDSSPNAFKFCQACIGLGQHNDCFAVHVQAFTTEARVNGVTEKIASSIGLPSFNIRRNSALMLLAL